MSNGSFYEFSTVYPFSIWWTISTLGLLWMKFSKILVYNAFCGHRHSTFLKIIAYFLFFNLFLNWRIISLQNCIAFCQPQHESATGIHISPLSWTSFPYPSPSHPTKVDTEPLFEFPETYSKFPLVIYFTHGNVSFHVTLSIHLTLSPCP